MRYVSVALLMVVLAGGCSSSESEAAATTTPPETTTTTATTTTTTTAPTTTTTTQPTTTTLSEEEVAEQQFEADLVLIKQMWRRHSDLWFSGIEARYQSLASYNHPLFQCSVEDFRNYYALQEGWQEEHILDVESVERDDG